MADPALSLSCQALGVTEFLETALTSRTVCIGGTLKSTELYEDYYN